MDAHGQQWNLRKYTSFSFQKVAHPSGTTVQLAAETCDINSFPPYTGRNRLPRLPLLLADIAFIDRPSYRPKPPDWRTDKTMCLDKSIPCAHKTMTLHTHTLSMTFTNNFCACQSSPFTDIRLICSVFVEFITSFFHVLTCFNGCVAAMEA